MTVTIAPCLLCGNPAELQDGSIFAACPEHIIRPPAAPPGHAICLLCGVIPVEHPAPVTTCGRCWDEFYNNR